MNKSEIKYTSDGKKVIVVGKLNAQETIVQEIFVSGEVEFPSGENFVVKSLHDVPAESWKEKTLRELEERYKREEAKWRQEINTIEKSLKATHTALRKKFESLRGVESSVGIETFNVLAAFMAGEIKFLVRGNYAPDIIDLDEAAVKRDHYGDVDLRLISLYGRSRGDLTWKIGEYYDGSGSQTNITLCRTKEEAISIAQAILDKCESYEEYVVTAAQKNGLVLDPEKMAVYKEKKTAILQKSIEAYESDIEKKKAEIEKLNNR